MIDETVTPEDITTNIVFHDRLNPDLWDDDGLKLGVRVRLLRTALSFYQFIDLDGLVISDIIMTGSNASYNYTPLSDIDVHLVVDFSKTDCPDLASNFFTTKKSLWNATHDISILGHVVELYVEDKATPVQANGIFSLLKGEWVKFPEDAAPTWDEDAVVTKTEALADRIEDILASPTVEAIDTMLDALKAMRQKGLAADGEFSTDNLTYKSLRNLGLLDRLFDTKQTIIDQSLSV